MYLHGLDQAVPYRKKRLPRAARGLGQITLPGAGNVASAGYSLVQSPSLMTGAQFGYAATAVGIQATSAAAIAASPALTVVQTALPYVGAALVVAGIMMKILGGGKGYHQGIGSAYVAPDYTVTASGTQQFQGTANLQAITELAESAAKLVAFVAQITKTPLPSNGVSVGIGNANDQFNIVVTVGGARVLNDIAGLYANQVNDWTARGVILALQSLPLPDYAKKLIGSDPTYNSQAKCFRKPRWRQNSLYGQKTASWIGNPSLVQPAWVLNTPRPLIFGAELPITRTIPSWLGVPAKVYPPSPAIITPPGDCVTYAEAGRYNPIGVRGDINGIPIDNFTVDSINNLLQEIVNKAALLRQAEAEAEAALQIVPAPAPQTSPGAVPLPKSQNLTPNLQQSNFWKIALWVGTGLLIL